MARGESNRRAAARSGHITRRAAPLDPAAAYPVIAPTLDLVRALISSGLADCQAGAMGIISGTAGRARDRLADGADPLHVLHELLATIERVDRAVAARGETALGSVRRS